MNAGIFELEYRFGLFRCLAQNTAQALFNQGAQAGLATASNNFSLHI
jgi:hypothetical protein